MPIPGHLGVDGCPSPPVFRTGEDGWKIQKRNKHFYLGQDNATVACFVKHAGTWHRREELEAERRNKRTKARRQRRKALKAKLAVEMQKTNLCTGRTKLSETQQFGNRRQWRNWIRAQNWRRRRRSEGLYRMLERSGQEVDGFEFPVRTSKMAVMGTGHTQSRNPMHPQWVVAPTHGHPLHFSKMLADGLLFIVRARVHGVPARVLIDSGATRCFVAASSVTTLGMYCKESTALLELADGSKLLSKGMCPNVQITLGSCTTTADLTVTTLLHNRSEERV